MAEINAEQALSYAENMLNWVRSLRYLEETCRFVRGVQNAIPRLQQELQEAEERKVKADAAAEAAETSARDRIAGFEADVRVVQDNTNREIQAIKQEILGQRQVMEQERERFRVETATLHTDFAAVKDALAREAEVLQQRVDQIALELKAAKERAASL